MEFQFIQVVVDWLTLCSCRFPPEEPVITSPEPPKRYTLFFQREFVASRNLLCSRTAEPSRQANARSGPGVESPPVGNPRPADKLKRDLTTVFDKVRC
jgi:hypothetical protein